MYDVTSVIPERAVTTDGRYLFPVDLVQGLSPVTRNADLTALHNRKPVNHEDLATFWRSLLLSDASCLMFWRKNSVAGLTEALMGLDQEFSRFNI